MRKVLSSHATLTDVARLAGVGTTTVSRVINGGEGVRPDTLTRVQAVIEKLGYQPNQSARILKGHQAKAIGLIVPSIADAFFSSCAEAAQEIARSHDSLLIVTVSNNDPAMELENLNLLTRRTDGLLLAPADSHNEKLARLLNQIPIPSVSFDRPVENSIAPSVVSDNFQGAREATKHLISHGYKRILCLGGEPSLYTLQERVRGYREAMREARLPVLIDLSITDHLSAVSVLRKLLSSAQPPDAVFTLKNFMTIYTYEALSKLRVSIPDKLALFGFDDFELAKMLHPAVSVVEQPIESMGRTAAELLFSRMASGAWQKSSPRQKSEQIKLQNRLVLRGSCGCRYEAD